MMNAETTFSPYEERFEDQIESYLDKEMRGVLTDEEEVEYLQLLARRSRSPRVRHKSRRLAVTRAGVRLVV